jgi:hypothetical protein
MLCGQGSLNLIFAALLKRVVYDPMDFNVTQFYIFLETNK